MQAISKRKWGPIIFLAGSLIGLVMAILVTWGDYEAASYFNSGAEYESFSGLACPALMSRSEVATVSATFSNPSSKEIQPYYEAEISGAAASRHLEDQLPVPPHASRTVSWTVSSKDIDLGSFVMVKLDVLPFAGNPARETTCGMVVLNTGALTGGEVLAGGIGLSLLGMLAGLGLGETGRDVGDKKAQSISNVLRAVGVATLLALLTALAGSWLISVILCAITILTLAILLRVATT